jgi:integrase
MLTATGRPARALEATMSVSKVWDLFADDMVKFGPLSDDGDDDAANISRRPRRWKSARQSKSTLRLWTRVYGDKPIGVWTRKQAVDLRRLFIQLPQKYGQGKQWRGKTPMTIAAEYQAQIKAEPNPERQHELLSKANKFKTWNRHLAVFNALLPWAASNGLVAHGTPSPFRKLFVWVDDDLDPSEGGSEKRKMWLERQLAKLLASPLFTGFRSPSRLWMPGDMMVQDALYWVILIVAHSGMRREEPCQLLVKHVVQDKETGIW